MQSIKSITIPQPCHENWNQMTPVEQGRHCVQCNKTVTDFTVMTNTEIINYFAQQGNVCGRFESQQLAGLNNDLAVQEKPCFSWKKLVIAAAVTSLFATADADAQRTVGKVKVSQSFNPVKDVPAVDSISYSTVKGKIIDAYDNSPIQDVSLMVKNSGLSTKTDSSGTFVLTVPSTADSLVISRLGYDYTVINIKDFNTGTNCVALKSRRVVLGGAITVVRVKKIPFYKVLWYKMGRIF
ncbi:carboxypeptidase-like regulatory domain-containing protein [Mucilaginibacter aquariorum]|uniref:Carboxypeptidase-like regulatory domain-containing protein n=1 Tax=Mucilaginibacter aquariorum TaxID=2967225 RepID=A0ABT1T0E6_9SPHI|nr:carboxypeptidase-like regulatory domain-containing protein [Mucilaginibacter aquariorum]MCQ6957935.1 carboxypeptidase-like regulatory domain-containing protein [Mucilaginibacter aquariorum]